MNLDSAARGSPNWPGEAAATAARDKRNAFIASFLGWCLDGFETYTAVLVGHQVVAGLVAPTASAVYFGGILGITLAAWACGGLLSGVLADYFGRKRVMMFSIVWYGIFTGLTALSPNYAVFMVLRFLTGLGMGAEWGPGSALVSEMWSNRSRGRGIALLQGGFGVGFLLATGVWAFVNTGTDAWRWMFVIGILPALLVLFVWRYAKDPAMWLDAKRRREQAQERAATGHELGHEDKALTTFTMVHVFRDRVLRPRVWKLLVLSTVTLLGWWAVSTWVPQFGGEVAAAHHQNPTKMMTTVALWYNVGGVIGYFAMGVFNDFLGRKKTLWWYFLGALVMNVVLFGFVKTPGALPVATAINGFFTLGVITWIATWPVELFPTYVRGTAITIIFNATRYIAAAGAVLSGYLVDAFGSVSTTALVIGSIYILGLIFTFWTGPETKGEPLPH